MTVLQLPAEMRAQEVMEAVARRRGLVLHVDPPDDFIPPFLRGYRPSALALSDNGGGIIFMVVRQGFMSDFLGLDDISRLVATHPEWEFQVLYPGIRQDHGDPLPLPTLNQLTARLDQVEALAADGHAVPALLLGWTVLEALTRVAVPEAHNTGAWQRTGQQAVQTLAENGYLPSETAKDLRRLADKRQAAAHGDFSVAVSMLDVEALVRALRAIISDLAAT